MAIDPRQEILRMMMAQTQRSGGGGQMMPPGVMPPGAIPPSAMPAVGGYGRGGGHVGPESREATTPSDRDPEFDPEEYQGMSDPGMQGGLPPEIMKLASLGIGPQEMGIDMGKPRPSGYPRTGSTDADSEDAVNESRRSMTPSDEEPAPAEMMDEPRDPRFGPQDDPVRDETEGELGDARQAIMGAQGDEEADWEGTRTPTDADLEYVREHPTDGVLNSFFERFPDWTAEDILMRGGDPSKSPDEYATSDEEWERMQSDRSTRIDER